MMNRSHYEATINNQQMRKTVQQNQEIAGIESYYQSQMVSIQRKYETDLKSYESKLHQEKLLREKTQ